MADADPDRPPFAERFAEGVDHFNAGRYWEAHESWETLWLASRSELRQFLQGLIQLAAAYLHLGRSNFSGASRLFASGLQKLDDSPDGCRAFVDPAFLTRARIDQGRAAVAFSEGRPPRLAGSPPRIDLVDGWRANAPRGDW